MTPDDARQFDPGYGEPPEGHRLPPASRVGVVRLQVADLERSTEYYGRVLGMRSIGGGAGSAVLGPHGEDVPLIELHELAGASPVPARGRLGLYHFALLLPDRASLGRFVDHLSRIGARAGASHHLVSEALYLHDPDGLGIEVYADLPREQWRHRGRELEMDSRPLDMQDLLRAGGGAEWTGMPAGSRIGHVHLHVGDLERATDFYHRGVGLDRMVWSYPGALFLAAGGYHHHLGVNTWAANAAPAGEGDARLLEWEILVPAEGDADAVAASLRSAGFEARLEGGEVTASDPWGTQLRVRPVHDPAAGMGS
jgi:catechol 2,3-dioxygenase